MTPNEPVIQVTDQLVVVVDLDDTLYKEVDFVRSGFRAVARELFGPTQIDLFDELMRLYEGGGGRTFQEILGRYRLSSPSVDDLVQVYRDHQPSLDLPADSARFLSRIGQHNIPLGLITDGRSRTQRNKLRALGIEECFRETVISEEFGSTKPDRRNYLHFESVFPDGSFVYIGDNLRKDFVAANQLGWMTISLLDNGENIHSQQVTLPSEYHPTVAVNSLDEIVLEECEGV